MASVASHNGTSVKTGDDIMIAGLAFQVFTLLVFMLCSLDFTLTTVRRHRKLGAAALNQDDRARRVRGSFIFKGFLGALGLATVCIFWRSVFRVAELSDGWTGELMGRQDLFIGFEGVMVVVAALSLNIFHPAICFREMLEGSGGLGSLRASRTAKKSDSLDSEMGGVTSEVASESGVKKANVGDTPA